MGLAVITGGGRGIGAAISRRLAKDGHQILLTYNTDSQSAESVIADLRKDNVDCVAAKVDCGNTDEVFILADHPWMKNGVDILVLNHGMYQRSSAKELTLDELELTMDVNFKGSVAVYTALCPHLNNSAKITKMSRDSAKRFNTSFAKSFDFAMEFSTSISKNKDLLSL